MRSKTSSFNKQLFRKNLSRFAPAWGLYTLCLILGTLLVYSNGGTMKQFHFASNMADMPQYMALINLAYAPVVAQLLFGDLYNSRMCNALHAMPIRRESWFCTNILSGLVFSILPGLVMALLSTVLCGGSIIRNAWQIPWLTLAASILQFICFFGIAIFATMCAGNRLGMLLIYGLLNGGALIAYWLVDTVYTPMLYGVITPDNLAETLTPVAGMMESWYMQVNDQLYTLRELFGENLEGASSGFTIITEKYMHVFLWAAAGIGFALIGLVLYKKRDLECAGDALAFKAMEPVFQVLGAVVCAAAAQFFLYMFVSSMDVNYLFLAAGLLVGWFACRMLIERSTRVFRPKNWIGLGALTAVLAVSLLLTHMDIFGIETWQPKLEKVQSVEISGAYGYEMTDKEDIQKVLNMQSEALDTRLETSGAYVQDETGAWVPYERPINTTEELAQLAQVDCRKAFGTTITYILESGKEVRRSYCFWSDTQAGDNAREIQSRWDVVNNDTTILRGKKEEIPTLDLILPAPAELYVDGVDRIKKPDADLVDDLMTAIQADCAEGNMAKQSYLHNGHFRQEDPDAEGGYRYRDYLSISLENSGYGWYLEVFPDSAHTLAFLRENGLLAYDVMDTNLCWY